MAANRDIPPSPDALRHSRGCRLGGMYYSTSRTRGVDLFVHFLYKNPGGDEEEGLQDKRKREKESKIGKKEEEINGTISRVSG